VKHHFVSCLEPGEPFSAGEFQRQGRIVLAELNARGLPAVVAGGSGLYTSALLDGLFEGPEKNLEVRARIEAEAAAEGAESLYTRLQAIDPEYAAIIDEQDVRRIVRGLEVYEIAGCTLTELHREHQARADRIRARFVAIHYPRAVLYQRINDRVDAMLEAGFLDELRALLEAGHEANLLQLRTLGYREFLAYLRGEATYEEARANMQRNTRRYAKRQLTWFRADTRIEWIEPDDQAAWIDRLMEERAATA
jgi:tRNA dimethylallyltransferase